MFNVVTAHPTPQNKSPLNMNASISATEDKKEENASSKEEQKDNTSSISTSFIDNRIF